MHVLKTVVEPATKTHFRSLAHARGLSESELLRAVILAATGQDADKEPEPDPENTALARMTVRLPGFLQVALQERARCKGMAPSRYVAALVQSHMTRQPVMVGREIRALLASARELAALGRNVHQIAQALGSACPATESAQLDVLAALQVALDENRTAIRALVRASQNAWEAS